jgi:hypothetical protein
MSAIRVGCGAANSTERIDLSLQMVEKGDVAYVGFDNLAERTLAFAQLERLRDPRLGYNPLLGPRMHAMLRPALERGIKIVGNMGAANPVGGGEVILAEADALGIPDLTVAVVTGDDLVDLVTSGDVDFEFWETGGGLETLPGEIVSANAYIGSEPMTEALAAGADVVVAGRCADLSPYVAMLSHEFGWKADDWNRRAAAGVVGHLLECGRYITGGTHADPYFGKTVPNMEDLSLPLAEVGDDGSIIISKVEGTGGLVTVGTCKEQLLHEIHDPSAYVSPDVVIDMTSVTLTADGPDRVRVAGAKGRPAPENLKLLVGVKEGWIAEGEISFAGFGALEKAEKCIDLVKTRLARTSAVFDDFRADLIGVDSIFGMSSRAMAEPPFEIRLRIAARTAHYSDAEMFVTECENLWFGPIGGGGNRSSIREVLAMYSALIPRSQVPLSVQVIRRLRLEIPG